MFTVEITADAKAALEAKLKEFAFLRPGVMIVREGPKADVFRSKDGATVWNIERPDNPWGYHVGSFDKYPDAAFQIVNGIRVCLAVVPQEDEKGVVIRLRNGEPVIEPLAPRSALWCGQDAALHQGVSAPFHLVSRLFPDPH